MAIAAAMVHRPALLLLDEPTSQLDPVAGDELIWMLRRLNEEWGTAVVIAEHRLERCLPAADRVLAIEGATIACDAPPRAFLDWAMSQAPALVTPAARLFGLAGLTPAPVSVKQARATLRAVGIAPSAGPTDDARARKVVRLRRRQRRDAGRGSATPATSGSSLRTGRPCCAASTSASSRASWSR